MIRGRTFQPHRLDNPRRLVNLIHGRNFRQSQAGENLRTVQHKSVIRTTKQDWNMDASI
uniref:Uncharacterized protein n=1 Tax=viral metagenome TaxID=1070528 RepID=A0A6M3IN14_9ZZZZ